MENRKCFERYAEQKNASNTRSRKAIERHTVSHGKLLVWDRIKALIDPGSSFFEIGSIMGHDMDYADIPGAGTVVGIGRVSGTDCVVTANDATLKGGTVYPATLKKQLRAQELSAQLALPIVYMTDSGGAFLPLQAEIFPDQFHGGRAFYNESVMGSLGIPQISVVCGSCTAGAAYIPSLADDNIMVDKMGTMFLGGPPLVKAATGETIDAENLGGARVHCSESGGADYFAPTESDAFNTCRDIVLNLNYPSFEPKHSNESPLYHPCELDGVTNESVRFDQVIARIVDGSRFQEFRALYGDYIRCGFASLEGNLIGVIGSTGVGESVSKSYLKTAQFVQMCNQRDIPMLFLPLSSGHEWPQLNSSEHGIAAKALAQAMHVIALSVVPKIVLYTGNAFGMDYNAMCPKSFDPCFSFCWPNATLSIVNPSSQDQDSGSVDRLSREASAIFAASRLIVDEVIMPSSSRDVLARAFAIAKDSARRHRFLRERSSERLEGVMRM